MSGKMMCLKLSGWKGHQVVANAPLVVFVCFVFPSFCFSNWKSQRNDILISDRDLNNSSGNLTACINLLLPMWCKGENWGEDGRSGQLWPQPGADVEADHVDNQPTKGQPWPRPQPKPSTQVQVIWDVEANHGQGLVRFLPGGLPFLLLLQGADVLD